MSKLTTRQREILDFIQEHMARHGSPPTRAEIALRFGFRSPNASEAHLRALAKKGVIELRSGLSRGIRLTELSIPRAKVITGEFPRHSGRMRQLPLVGRVAAGSPILAAENIEEHFTIDPNLFHPRPQYLLRVIGLSMTEAGILDGDLLAVHRTPEASNRQIVVARLDDEVTVKRYERRGSKVRLLPANPAFKPIRIDLKRQTLIIEGLAVGVIRNQMG